MARQLWVVLALQLALAASCCTQGGGQSKSSLKALFIGNSYTYYNDLPALVRELAAADDQTLTTDEHLGPNNSIFV